MTRSYLVALAALAALGGCSAPKPLDAEAQSERRAQEVEDSDTEDAVQRMKDEFNTLHPDG